MFVFCTRVTHLCLTKEGYVRIDRDKIWNIITHLFFHWDNHRSNVYLWSSRFVIHLLSNDTKSLRNDDSKIRKIRPGWCDCFLKQQQIAISRLLSSIVCCILPRAGKKENKDWLDCCHHGLNACTLPRAVAAAAVVKVLSLDKQTKREKRERESSEQHKKRRKEWAIVRTYHPLNSVRKTVVSESAKEDGIRWPKSSRRSRPSRGGHPCQCSEIIIENSSSRSSTSITSGCH